MNRRFVAGLVIAALVALALTGCSASKPEDVVKAYIALVEKGDYKTAWDMYSPELQKARPLALFVESRDQAKAQLGPTKTFTIDQIEINGATARVETTSTWEKDQTPYKTVFVLTKESYGWKLAAVENGATLKGPVTP